MASNKWAGKFNGIQDLKETLQERRKTRNFQAESPYLNPTAQKTIIIEIKMNILRSDYSLDFKSGKFSHGHSILCPLDS